MEDRCSVAGCADAARTRGWCSKHYQRWRKHGDPLLGKEKPRVSQKLGPCAVEGCEKRCLARGLCSAHYRRLTLHGDPLVGGRKQTPPCKVEDCDRLAAGRGYCDGHYRRLKLYGSPTGRPDRPRRSGKRYIDKKGYALLYLPEHPNARPDGKLFEHTVVMAEALGRPLHKGETVHHKNGMHDDNCPENLELWASAHRAGQRVADIIRFANEMRDRYGTDPEPYE